MKLPSYKEALVMGKEKIKEALAPIKAKSAQKKAELEMIGLEEKIATLESEVYDECCKEDVNFKLIIDKQDEIALQKRRLKQYSEIIEQMFPRD